MSIFGGWTWWVDLSTYKVREPDHEDPNVVSSVGGFGGFGGFRLGCGILP